MRNENSGWAAKMSGPDLKEAIRLGGWRSQAAFARELGVSADAVGKWCDGRRPVPRYVGAYLELHRAFREYRDEIQRSFG